MLLASPEAAASPWVNREIEHWFATRDAAAGEQLLVVLTKEDGRFAWETSTAIPPALRERLATEPRVVDVRWARDAVDVSLHNIRFRDAVADVALPIHGYTEKADLYGEDAAQHRRTRRVVRGAIVVLALLFLAAVAAAVVALVQRGEARAQRDRAEAEARTALSRQLAAQSLNAATDNELDLARVLALEAYRTEPTVDARSSLVSALQSSLRAAGVVGGPRVRVTKFAFDPGSMTVATGGDDGAVRLWDAATGRARTTLLPQSAAYVKGLKNGSVDAAMFDAAVASLAFSGDGRTLAAGRFDGRVLLFDVARSRPRGTFREPRGVVVVALNGDGSVLAVGVGGRRVSLWDVRRGRRLAAQPPGRVPGQGSDLEGSLEPAMSFSPDSTLLAWKSDDAVELWDVRAGRRHSSIAKNGQDGLGNAGSFAFVLGGRMIALTSTSGTTLWDVRRRAVVRTIGTRIVNELAADADGRVLAELGSDELVVRDLPSGRVRYAVPIDLVTDRHPAVGAGGRVVAHYDVDSAAVRLWKGRRDVRPSSLLAGRVASNVAFAPRGRLVALDVRGRILRDVANARPAPGDDPPLSQLAVSRDGRLALAGRFTGTFRYTIELRDLATGKLRRDAVKGQDPQLVFDVDGRALALTRSGGGPLTLWDVGRGKRIARFPGGGGVYALSAHGLAAVQDDTRLALWSTRTGQRVHQVPRADYGPATPVFSPDGATLATGGPFGLTLYDVPELRNRATLRTMSAPFAFSSDSRVLAATFRGRTVRLFDVRTGRPLGAALPLAGPLDTLAFAPDGRLVGVDGRGRVFVWDGLLAEDRLGPWRSRLCGVTAANLSPTEWARFLGDAPPRATCPGRG